MPDKGRNMPAISYEELTPGYEFPPTSYKLTSPFISKYVKAVDSPGAEFVPPLAIAACAMSAMAGSVSFPPGTIHASQEFEFFKLVPIGTVINCHTRVVRKLARTMMRMLVLELNILDENKERVQSGKATIVLPVQRTNAQ